MDTQKAVYRAINAVQADLAREGISKDHRNQQQGYSFRGIDDVYNALSPLLAKHKLCILPRILTRTCIERESKNGGLLFNVVVEAEFDFISAEDGSCHTVRTFGEAMDSADKATNKAMSGAYKYAAFQGFAIPTEGDNDADASHHEVKPPVRPPQQAEAKKPLPLPSKNGAVRKATTRLGEMILEYCNDDTNGASQILRDITGQVSLKFVSEAEAEAAIPKFEAKYLNKIPTSERLPGEEG